MTIPSSFTAPATQAALNSKLPLSGFKALVCLYFYGGIDGRQVVVPTGDNPNIEPYELYRPTGVRIEQNELLPMAGITDWGLNPNATYFRSRWDEGRLAVVQEVGRLLAPTTKANFSRTLRPSAVFGHNTGTDKWFQGTNGNLDSATGWFGRCAALLNGSFNADVASGNMWGLISTKGNSWLTRTYPPLAPVRLPPPQRNERSSYGSGTAADELATRLSGVSNATASQFGIPPYADNLVTRGFRDLYATGINDIPILDATLLELPVAAQAALDAAPDAFRPQLVDAARSIYTALNKPELGVSRQLLLVAAPGGYDHHGIVRKLLNNRLADTSAGLAAFDACMMALGLGDDQVTVFTASEFGRTMRSNANEGTDHAWSNHHFVFGGAVTGGLYGGAPDYNVYGKSDPTGWDDGNSQGRFIPQVSTEQYFATLLEWLDIPQDLIPLVLPGLPLFTPTTLGFMQ